jgi:Domain of unknown function (DUF4123)
MSMDVIAHFENLKQTREHLNLYALVDGLGFEAHTGERIEASSTHRSLFEGTPDAPLAHAGAWVVDIAKATDQIAVLSKLETAQPAVAWLITAMDIDGVTQFLQLQQDMQTADGHIALLRLADPRVIVKINQVMTTEQKQAFFGQINQWHLLDNGQHRQLGASDA